MDLPERVRYLSFKKLLSVLVVLVAGLLAGLVIGFGVGPPHSTVIFALLMSWVVTEAINHAHIANIFNMQDRFILYPI